ncbi:MAG: formylglycine-generating enzyme family protein [Kiritimatiellia bacterium]
MKINKILVGVMAVFVSMIAMAANPTISNVTVKQQWPWSRLVNIDYVLTCDPEQSIDIILEAYDGSSRLVLPLDSFSGDLFGVSGGARRIVWDPTKTAYADKGVVLEFRVELTPMLEPLYMIVDLTKSAGETGQTEYVYEADITNGLWGAWVRNPVTNDGTVVESVVWTGVTTNDIYRTDKLVLRRIPAGTFTMGWKTTAVGVTLSQGLYAGIYQVTQAQWENVMGTNPSYFNSVSNPVERVSYDIVRGATNSVPAIDWPGTGAAVLSSSFMGVLRAKTLTGFDLPTAAQWEYVCRARTTTYHNNGRTDGSAENFYFRDEWGWVTGNSGNMTHPVGQKAPNAWGLYDMHGNVNEWCLDWFAATLSGGSDPDGPELGTQRVMRGGRYSHSETTCHSALHLGNYPYLTNQSGLGFRLVITLP